MARDDHPWCRLRARPDRVLSTIRNTEVLADPTAPLALEAAVRRRNGEDTVRLCAACRVLRLQPIPDVPGFTQHFALFALVTSVAPAFNALPTRSFKTSRARSRSPPDSASTLTFTAAFVVPDVMCSV